MRSLHSHIASIITTLIQGEDEHVSWLDYSSFDFAEFLRAHGEENVRHSQFNDTQYADVLTLIDKLPMQYEQERMNMHIEQCRGGYVVIGVPLERYMYPDGFSRNMHQETVRNFCYNHDLRIIWQSRLAAVLHPLRGMSQSWLKRNFNPHVWQDPQTWYRYGLIGERKLLTQTKRKLSIGPYQLTIAINP